MTIEVQYKLKSNPLYIKYLREHSYWYRTLNRYPESIDHMIEEAKKEYKLRGIDKIGKVIEYMEFFSSLVSSMK